MKQRMSEPLQLFTEAIALQNEGRFEEAIAKYDEFLLGYVGSAQMHTNRGLALFELGRTGEAIAAYREAVLADADYFDAHYSMGRALFLERRYPEATVSFDHAITLVPSHDAYVSRGAALFEMQAYDAALLDYDQALLLEPRSAKAYMNKGFVFYELERLDEALACYEQALALQPGHHGTEWNVALCLLRAGDFKRGWPYYERRLQGSLSQPLDMAEYDKPRFLGEGSLAGKTILLWSEQGNGDVLQFCRYAYQPLQMGAQVILAVYPSLLRLIETSFAGTGIRVILGGKFGLSEFDFHTPLMSLPLAFGTNSLEKIPANTPYLFAVPEDVVVWQKRIESEVIASPQAVHVKGSSKAMRVGLVWAGGHRPDEYAAQKADALRSLCLEEFAPLLALSQTMGILFFSLQLGEAAKQLQTPPKENFSLDHSQQGLPIIDLTADLHDWADTAALVANLDLVISCDTAVAHLAAAMGKPTWILSRFNGCWRWLQDRDDSPWYPTVRLFRQKTRGDWATVIDEVVAALQGQAKLKEVAHE